MNSLIVLLFCLSDEDLKKKFFGFEKKSLIDRISCFSINMAHVILNPYQKKICPQFFFCQSAKKVNLEIPISNRFNFFSKSTLDSPAMI